MKLKINKLNNIRIIALGVILIFFTSSGTYSNPIYKNSAKEFENANQIETTVCYKVQLKSGWNIFSSPFMSDSADIKFNFQNLIDNGSLVKIQDEQGWSLENIGIFGGWSNNIGDIIQTEGYKIKVNADDSIEFCGTLVNYPYPIPLNAGWNIIGYPRLDSVNALNVLEELITKGTLIKVQDEKGQSIEDLGNYGGWQNFIGVLNTGEGYKIKLDAPDTLWIYESYTDTIPDTPKNPGEGFKSIAINSQLKSTKELNLNLGSVNLEYLNTSYFETAYQGNGVDHMNFYLVDFPDDLLETGDEIAVFDGEICVGAISITDKQLNSQILSLSASSADLNGSSGFIEGNRFKFRIWKAATNDEINLTYDVKSGKQFFTKNESSILSLEKSVLLDARANKNIEEVSINCYPNPFQEQVIIQIRMSKESLIDVSVFNQFGQKVKSLINNETMSKGIYQLTWNGKEDNGLRISSGIYFVNVTTNGKVYHKKVLFQK